MDLAGRLMSGIKSAAGAGFNLLPDRMNLFARYLTGVGNTNLQLDPSTERSLIQATEIPPMATQLMPTFPNKESAFTGDFSQREMIPLPVPAAGPGIGT